MLSLLRKIESYFELRTPIVWKNATIMLFIHLCAFYGLFLIPSAKISTVLWAHLVVFIGDLAVSAGVHRLWTHRTYKAKLPMRIIIMLCYMMAGEYSIVQWARDHRTHHLYADTDADPHNATRGLFYSHVGWLLMKRHPESIEKGKRVDVSDLYKDPVIQFHQKHYYILLLLLHIIFPSAVAYYWFGDTLKNAIFIAFFFRSVLSLNMIWCVNSLAHYWGDKPYDKNILASQNAFMAFFLVGEGWHNFHHVFPFDYRIGEFGPGLQFGGWFIDQCARIGWAYNLRKASPKEIQRAIENNNKKIQKEKEEEIMANKLHNQ